MLHPNETTVLSDVHQFVENNPAFTVGGVRYLLFNRGPELEEAGAVIRFGRRVLIDEVRMMEWLRQGNARSIVPKTTSRQLREVTP